MAEHSPALAIFCFSEFGQNRERDCERGIRCYLQEMMMKQFSQFKEFGAYRMFRYSGTLRVGLDCWAMTSRLLMSHASLR